jgi:hypothetical protein
MLDQVECEHPYFRVFVIEGNFKGAAEKNLFGIVATW